MAQTVPAEALRTLPQKIHVVALERLIFAYHRHLFYLRLRNNQRWRLLLWLKSACLRR